MFLHQEGLQGSPGRCMGPLPQSPTIRKPPRPLLWRVHPQLGALEKKSFASAGKARTLKVSQERRCWRLSRDFGPGCAQPCAGLQNEPCRALLVQLFGCSDSWCCLDSVSQALLHEHPAARRAGRVPRSF